jgi:hypothetical protein
MAERVEADPDQESAPKHAGGHAQTPESQRNRGKNQADDDGAAADTIDHRVGWHYFRKRLAVR